MNSSSQPYEVRSDNLVSVVLASVFIATSVFILARATSRSLRRPSFAVLTDSAVRHLFPLIEKITVSGNTKIFRFGLPSQEHVLGLPVGKHIMLAADLVNPLTGVGPAKYVARQYTPITSDYSSKGYFELLVKIYRQGENPRYPEGGWMSQYLDSLSLGDTVQVRGPLGRIEYLNDGKFKISNGPAFQVSHVGMIAGGTGITPMYQLISHVLRDEKNTSNLKKLSLLFGNQHPEDILLRDQLEDMASTCPEQFRLAMTVDEVHAGQTWEGYTGYVSMDMIKASFPDPSSELLILLCGPPGMVKSAETLLLQAGYLKDRIVAY